MKKLFLFSAVVLLCASFGWAQDQSQAPATDNSNSAQVGTVRGCLGGSDGNYTLTQDQSGSMFKLVGGDDQLKTHVGQEVLVTGQLSAGSASGDQGSAGASANANANSSGATATSSTGSASSGNMVQVTDVKMVSQTCSSGSSAPPSQQ
jgi:hypothetical protein